MPKVAVLCTIASAIGFYLSLNLGDMWPLAWVAPIPVLWLAFGQTRGWIVFAATWAAYALGCCNLLPAYAGSLPVFVLAIGLTAPALGFAGCAVGARYVARHVSPLAGVLVFASLWTTWDYAASFGQNGTAPSPAYSQVAAPYLIQGASAFGLWIITFLLGLVPAGIAMGLQKRTPMPAVVALVLFGLNAGFGAWRISHADETRPVRVGLAVDDGLGAASFQANAKTALDAVAQYAAVTRELSAQGAKLIVFPEKLAVLQSAWRADAISVLQAAARASGATIVIGFDDHRDLRRNEALILAGDDAAPSVYFKRHMVPGLEAAFVPGDSTFVLPDQTGVAICKDMDFQSTLRGDARNGHPTLLAVPAWDFDRDRWWHARLAIMRGVEDGFAVARAAKQGLLALSDGYGRIIALGASARSGMVSLVGDLPRGPGDTVYLHIGDVFAWASSAGSILLLGLALRRARKSGEESEFMTNFDQTTVATRVFRS
jgi:apolipoprotein N-acyltransferase